MLKNILGKTKNLESDTDAVFKMNLEEMKRYLRGEKCNEDGLIAMMKRLVIEDEKSEKYYIQADDMDSKVKKAFELVLEISKNKKITVVAIELIHEFTVVYADIIKKFDTDYKEIYASRLNDAINNATNKINRIANIAQKIDTIK